MRHRRDIFHFNFKKMVNGILQPIVQGMLASGPVDAALAATGMGAYGAYRMLKRKRSWVAGAAYKAARTMR